MHDEDRSAPARSLRQQFAALPAVAACPADRDADTLLSVRIGTQPAVRLDRAAIARFATQQSV